MAQVPVAVMKAIFAVTRGPRPTIECVRAATYVVAVACGTIAPIVGTLGVVLAWARLIIAHTIACWWISWCGSWQVSWCGSWRIRWCGSWRIRWVIGRCVGRRISWCIGWCIGWCVGRRICWCVGRRICWCISRRIGWCIGWCSFGVATLLADTRTAIDACW